MRRLAFALGLACATPAVSLTANAQPAPPPAQAAAVSPPTLKKDSPAHYPDQALKDHIVETVVIELVLDVDANGVVKKRSSSHHADTASMKPRLPQRQCLSSSLHHAMERPSLQEFAFRTRSIHPQAASLAKSFVSPPKRRSKAPT